MTIVHATALDIEGARIDGLAAVPLDEGLLRGRGAVESPELPAAPFDELVGSWSADVPRGSSVEMRVQVRVDGRWSGWYGLGRWDSGGGSSLGEQADALGRVDVDTLKLARPADAARYRVTLGGDGRKPPTLTRVALALSFSNETPRSSPFSPGPWVRELAVPPRSQLEEQEKYKHDICSPTSLAMVLDFWGKGRPTATVAEAVRDRASTLFGNWPLNVAYAGTQGLRGHVARLDGLAGLERLIAAGLPAVVSVTFSEGQLTGAPIKKTKGHLMVVSGFTPEGDVIVRDPAAKTRAEARRVYRRAEFETVWAANKRGLAYVLGPAFPQDFVVALSSADLRRKPRAASAPSSDDPELASQLVYGERVRALRAKGEWVEVEALEQESRPKEWHPYRGWTLSRSLHWPPDAPGNAIVRVKRAEARTDDGALIELPLGARLNVEAWEGETARVRLLDGRPAAARSAELRRLVGPADRGRILQTARQLLGSPYVWGGRSPSGVDCSGLLSLSYRSEGVNLPRDAHEQFLRARPVERAELEPADALFLSKPGSPKTINHAMLYAGSDAIIESRQSAGKTLETSFRERFGKPLSEIESGDTVTDLSGEKPEKRKLYFGSFLNNK